MRSWPVAAAEKSPSAAANRRFNEIRAAGTGLIGKNRNPIRQAGGRIQSIGLRNEGENFEAQGAICREQLILQPQFHHDR